MQYLKYLCHACTAFICLCLISACGGGEPDKEGEAKISTMQSLETFESINDAEPITEPAINDSPLVEAPSQAIAAPVTARPSSVYLSGTITYDRVRFHPKLYKGLDYATTTNMPVRGATVELLDTSNSTLATGQTDERGRYNFSAPKNQKVRVRVVAELSGNSNNVYSVQVKDNTNRNALYVLDGSLVTSGDNATQTRNLHAESGWDGNQYARARSSAPFAVLDSIYDAVDVVIKTTPSVGLPPLNVYWSKNNISVGGSLSEGKIGTSFYTSAGPSIYLLGAENNDSDEFDRAVIQHEFGHYVEHQLSRTESLGGSHNVSSLLDLRVAFGEAWGNAFSGFASGDHLYRDSLGMEQGLGFTINVQARSYGQQGWFSEGTIQSILYNLYDDDNDANDRVSLGFKPIFNVLTSDEYMNHNGFASIYPFIEILKKQNPESANDIQHLLNSYSIFGTGYYGENETNNAGSLITLPVYHDLTIGQTINVCSDSVIQNYNGVDVYRLIKVSLPKRSTYTVVATKTSSFVSKANPQIRIYQQGHQVASFTSSLKDIESGTRNLAAGDYILEVFDQSNADNDNNVGGLVCFNVSIN